MKWRAAARAHQTMGSIRLSHHALIAGLMAFGGLAGAQAREGDAPVIAQTQNPPAAAQPAPVAPPQRHTAADGRAPGVIELMNQVEDLQAEINRLRGQLEVLSNGLENAQKRQRDMYLDLDTRVRRMEQGATTPAPRTEAPPTPASDTEARAKPATPGDAVRRVEPQGGNVPPAAGNPPPPVTTQTVPGPAAPTPPARPTAPATSTAAAPAGAASDTHVRRAYDSGLAAYRSGDYQGAIAAFDGIVKRYPRDPLAPNAQYWIGDAWFNLRDFRSAASAQQTLINNYPDSPKVPDAMLNLGSAYAAQGDGASARRTWEDLVARFPQTDAAEKGRQRLARLK